jgi:hypothetical protein
MMVLRLVSEPLDDAGAIPIAMSVAESMRLATGPLQWTVGARP